VTFARILTIAKRTAIALIVVPALVYAGDFVVIRIRQSFDSFPVRPYYAVTLKSGKIEYDYADPGMETCTYSLFPQLGYRPCWYVRRHPVRKIDVP
jgi:hypothetical protein